MIPPHQRLFNYTDTEAFVGFSSKLASSSSYLFISPKSRAYIFRVFFSTIVQLIYTYKDDIDDVLDYTVKIRLLIHLE